MTAFCTTCGCTLSASSPQSPLQRALRVHPPTALTPCAPCPQRQPRRMHTRQAGALSHVQTDARSRSRPQYHLQETRSLLSQCALRLSIVSPCLGLVSARDALVCPDLPILFSTFHAFIFPSHRSPHPQPGHRYGAFQGPAKSHMLSGLPGTFVLLWGYPATTGIHFHQSKGRQSEHALMVSCCNPMPLLLQLQQPNSPCRPPRTAYLVCVRMVLLG